MARIGDAGSIFIAHALSMNELEIKEQLRGYRLPTRFQASLYTAYEYWARVLAHLSDEECSDPAGYYQRKSDEWLEPCDIYLYQTSIAEIKKFGIAKDHRVRAKTADLHERKRYKKYLAHFRVAERRDALLIEQSLRGNMKLTLLDKLYLIFHIIHG